jgi:hypothetical protein
MRYRKLRIAISATCGIAFMLLIVLWVRSYWWADSVAISGSGFVTSMRGTVYVLGKFSIDNSPSLTFDFRSSPGNLISVSWFRIDPRPPSDNYLVRYSVMPFGNYIPIPHWCLAVLAAGSSIVPWLRWRFSLRALLIATALIAAVLGVVVYLSHH